MTARAAIIGGGVIGGGWAARFLLNGWDVAVHDPDPQAKRKIDEVLANARRSLPSIYDRALPPEGRMTFHDAVTDAVEGADWIQESVPERLDLKHAVFEAIHGGLKPGAILGSSTSGFKPSELNAGGAGAIVAHPFNPVYLLPLVELVGDAQTTGRAADILRGIGMFPLVVRKEIDAHIADRLLEAVWRESLWLVRDGIATTEEIDEAIRMGFGLRWGQMGLFETYRIAGGEAGMRHFMAQFGPALSWPWTRLMDVPEFTEDLVDLIAGQSDAQSGHRSIRELERLRDDNLVAMMRALKRNDSGAGGVIRGHERTMAHGAAGDGDQCQVPVSWTGRNGRITDAGYLEAGRQAMDRFVALAAGTDTDASFVATESHMRTLARIGAGDRLTTVTHLLGTDRAGTGVHLFVEMKRPDGTLLATLETVLVHESESGEGSSGESALARLAGNRASGPWPEGAGRLSLAE
ncbi:carnitine 3-dehydrogenase [Zhengella mangrovi]|uniref:L-carnitine dehydrogenase n=1 Tax=Zhengella mangrovi TaxID=1982044 RepID=A0A2G1QRS8_9HYPH|nr:3-hydroxyacyl-CoA dehydrogenase NAD-binding domain-containing protein [Zhengella mangrovi]PHP67908.1 carnitine 3-dehydrogenase [Zhengella mangrovi]